MWVFFLQMDKDVSWNNKLDNYRLIFKMAAPEKKSSWVKLTSVSL